MTRRKPGLSAAALHVGWDLYYCLASKTNVLRRREDSSLDCGDRRILAMHCTNAAF